MTRLTSRVRGGAVLAALAVAIALGACGGPAPAPASPAANGASPFGSPRALAAAPYVIETMRPHFSLNLPAGFVLQQLAVDQFFITRGPDAAGSGIAVVRLAQGDVVGMLSGAQGFADRSLVEVQIGSLVGHSIVLSSAAGLKEPPPIFASAELATPYVLPLGARGRVIEFTIEGTPVAVVYFAPAAEFGAFEGEAQGILGSLMFRS